jgi:thiol-disulfide isomerase/thioredoxin
MTGLWVLVAALAATGVLAIGLRVREGRVTAGRSPGPLPDVVRAALADGSAVTLVQISTTFCAVCPQAKAVLDKLADQTAGLAHVELDVTDRPEVAAELGVLRTPTTLAYSGDGTELLRVGGVPRRDSLINALRPHLP